VAGVVRASPEADDAGDDGFLIEGFGADLWYDPPARPAVTPTPVRAFPELTLLGIRATPGGYVALLRDEGSNRMGRVRSGDEFGGILIELISERGLTGVFDGRAYELALDGGGS